MNHINIYIEMKSLYGFLKKASLKGSEWNVSFTSIIASVFYTKISFIQTLEKQTFLFQTWIMIGYFVS